MTFSNQQKMADVKFSARAYCKIMLHAAKYPHCSVNGVLLAKCSKSQDSKRIAYTDAIPLFHICLHVSPMAEVALTQIDQMASESGLYIAGYYVANETLKDISVDKPANRIADKIAENFSAACLVVVDNKRVTLTMDEAALFHILQSIEGKWKPVERSSWVVEEHCLNAAATLLQRRVYQELIDFDNHLDNIALDWRNEEINDIVEEVAGEEIQSD